jgi:hypothetical protein
MKVKLLAVLALAAALTAAVAFAPGSSETAEAQTPPTATFDCVFQGMPGQCVFTLTSFQSVNGVLTAIGDLTGPGGLNVMGIGIPVRDLGFGGGVCSILDLTLGPIDLNLLGLRIQTNQIELLITAIPGGGLLGDLLCAVANLLNPNQLLRRLPADLLAQILNFLSGLGGGTAAVPTGSSQFGGALAT